jgi:predicted metal-dependent hydrolase
MIIAGIEVRIDRKNIKNMHLYVKPPKGIVSVSAPLKMSDEVIERFVRTKVSWLKKQKAKFSEQLRQTERQYISGETLYLWGKQYFLQVEHGSKNSLILSGNAAILTVRKESTGVTVGNVAQRENFVREWYRKQLKTEIEKVLPKWEEITGLKCNSWQTKYMTSKWGTCNYKTRTIWLNLQLAKKTHECLDYVILHELIHLTEKRHNEKFISLMDKYMPTWREVRNSLNNQILDFME